MSHLLVVFLIEELGKFWDACCGQVGPVSSSSDFIFTSHFAARRSQLWELWAL